MKTSAITLVVASALALGLSGVVRAETRVTTSEEININARALPDFSRVAVTGTVASTDKGKLLLQRDDGMVQADIHTKQVEDKFGHTEMLNWQFRPGDEVTLYGRLQKNRDMISVEPDSIYQPTSSSTATLYMMDDSKLESVRKISDEPSVRSSLHRYRANYREL